MTSDFTHIEQANMSNIQMDIPMSEFNHFDFGEMPNGIMLDENLNYIELEERPEVILVD